MANASNEYILRGTNVHFPYTPYASQFAMLDKVLRSIQQSQNAILESPTGTGKTLALLCGSLAWQDAQYALPEPPSLKTPGCAIEDDDDDDCDYQPTKRFRTSVVGPPEVEEQSGDGRQDAPSAAKVIDEPTPMSDGRPAVDVPSAVREHGIPKIYYGTRTHKQIAQVVRELRKTAYCDVRMCILASRKHTCIHPIISREPNLNEACREATAADINESLATRCGYYVGAAKMQERVEQTELCRDAWDLEDLLSVGRRRRMCPYYALQALKDRVDIIFCPYNYLIDPLVRKSFEINLSGQILILDEAHDIENVAREVASLTITSETLQAALRDLEATEKLHEDEDLQHSHHLMALMVSRLLVWLERRAASLDASSDAQSSDTLSGAAVVAELTELDMGPEDFGSLKNHYAAVKVEESNTESSVKQKIAGSTLVALDGLFTVLDFMYEDQLLHVEDYKVAIVKEMKPDNHGEEDTRRHRSRLKQVVSLNFWCFNPAVAFKHIKAVARSIILTSGTLSPMDSFHSELGVKFQFKLEVGNFVKSSRLWSGAIAVGPTSHSLNARYENARSDQFQDEVGRALLRICQVVPRGVLCFVPSYSLLDKLMMRWEVTGLLLDLQETKRVFCEPRDRRNADVTEVMRDYFEAVDSCRYSDSGVQGALLMAVCRGKISEGQDFADEYARAVVTIGIPFPSYQDLQVKLKQEYNNAHCRKHRLLSGQQWYQAQGYRALNKALGRCIRHNNDWGAILLLDDRFAQSASASYTACLCKWVRDSLVYYNDFDMAAASLEQFMKSPESLTATPTPNRILPCPRRDRRDRSDFCPSFSSGTPVKGQTASLRSSFEVIDLTDRGSPLPGLSKAASSSTALLGTVASPATASGTVSSSALSLGPVVSPTTPSAMVTSPATLSRTVLCSATLLGTVVCPATPSGMVSSSAVSLGPVVSPTTPSMTVTSPATPSGTVSSSTPLLGMVVCPATPSGTVSPSATSLGTVVCPTTPSGTVSSSTLLLGMVVHPATPSGTDSSSATSLGPVVCPATPSMTVVSPATQSGTILSSATSLGTVVCPATPSGTALPSTPLLGMIVCPALLRKRPGMTASGTVSSQPLLLPKWPVKTVSGTESPLATSSSDSCFPVQLQPRPTAVEQSASQRFVRSENGVNYSYRKPSVLRATFYSPAERSRNWIFEILSSSQLTHLDFLATVDKCHHVLVQHPQFLSSSDHVFLKVGNKSEVWKMEISSSEALDVGRCRSVLDYVAGAVTKGRLAAASKGRRLLYVRFCDANTQELPVPLDTNVVLFPFMPTWSEEECPVEADSTNLLNSIPEDGGSVVPVAVSPCQSPDSVPPDTLSSRLPDGVVPSVAEKSPGHGSGSGSSPTPDAAPAGSGREPWSPEPEADLTLGECGTIVPGTSGPPSRGTPRSSISGRGFQSSHSRTRDLPLPPAASILCNFEDVVQEVEVEYEAGSPPPFV